MRYNGEYKSVHKIDLLSIVPHLKIRISISSDGFMIQHSLSEELSTRHSKFATPRATELSKIHPTEQFISHIPTGTQPDSNRHSPGIERHPQLNSLPYPTHALILRKRIPNIRINSSPQFLTIAKTYRNRDHIIHNSSHSAHHASWN